MTDWKKFRAVFTICVALGWWSVWFPELAVWADAVCVVENEDEEQSVQQSENMVECETVQEICDGLLHADKEQVRVKSRLFMFIQQQMQKK